VVGGGTFVPTYTQTPLAKMEHIIMTMSTKCSLAEPDLDCYRQEWLLRSGRLGEATTPKLCIAAEQQSGLATRGDVWLVSEADPLHGEKESEHTLN